jgi:hypothetical protein
MYLQTCGRFKSANRKTVSHLRKVRKPYNLFKPANLRICELRNLFADRPHLLAYDISL